MLPVRTQTRPPARRDPAPSRLRYKLTRLWLRPGVRRATNLGVPAVVGLLAAWTMMAEYDVKAQSLALLDRVRRQGFAINDEEFVTGSTGIAAPVRDGSTTAAETLSAGNLL